jgi:hypothetical protein
MGIALTDEHHDWVANFTGFDPRKAKRDPAAQADPGASSAGQAGVLDTPGKVATYAATSVKNLVGDAVTEAGIVYEAAEQGVAGAVDKAGEALSAGYDAVTGLFKPATTPPDPPPVGGVITLSSQTEATSPGNRARTKLGVGERVVVTVTPGPGNWRASGAKLSGKRGTQVTMTAPDRPGDVDVTCDVGGVTQTISFKVIAPSTVHQDTVGAGRHITNNLPNAGFTGQIYVGPDDVNFSAVSFLEDEIGAKGSGSWTEKNGEGHSPNKAALGMTNTVVGGKGTKSIAVDNCWSGYIPGLALTDWTGQISWTIPWHWQCGSGKGLIGRFAQLVVTTAAGVTTISKAGATFTAPFP